jgi:c-di-GMP-binding flagellar brake protein YcgR
MDTAENRRRYARLPKSFRVEVSEFAFPLSGQPLHTVKSADISAGGIKVDSPRHFAPGDKVQVRVYIPSLNKYHPGFMKVFESDAGQHLVAIAEVAWAEEAVPGTSYVLGLKFLDVDQDDWTALSNLIRKQLGV